MWSKHYNTMEYIFEYTYILSPAEKQRSNMLGLDLKESEVLRQTVCDGQFYVPT